MAAARHTLGIESELVQKHSYLWGGGGRDVPHLQECVVTKDQNCENTTVLYIMTTLNLRMQMQVYICR